MKILKEKNKSRKRRTELIYNKETKQKKHEKKIKLTKVKKIKVKNETIKR